MNIDEERVKNLLKSKGCNVECIQVDDSKKPDFKVKIDNFDFFCEVKAVEGNSVLNALSTKIHEAVKQFDSVNYNSSKTPNVIFFCNHHDNDWIDSLDLIAILTGNFYADNGSRHKIYGFYSDGRIKNEKYKVSLYVWLTKNDRIVTIFTDEKGRLLMQKVFKVNQIKQL